MDVFATASGAAPTSFVRKIDDNNRWRYDPPGLSLCPLCPVLYSRKRTVRYQQHLGVSTMAERMQVHPAVSVLYTFCPVLSARNVGFDFGMNGVGPPDSNPTILGIFSIPSPSSSGQYLLCRLNHSSRFSSSLKHGVLRSGRAGEMRGEATSSAKRGEKVGPAMWGGVSR